MRAALVLAIGGLIFVTGPAQAFNDKQYRVCALELDDILAVKVDFSAQAEMGVRITREDGTFVTSFNNYFGRGAGDEWKSGAKRITVKMRKTKCLYVSVHHKPGGANPGTDWVPSQGKRLPGNVLGFEDGSDSDFDDAVVIVTGQDGKNKLYDPKIEG